MHSWGRDDAARDERQLLDLRWQELKDETAKVGLRWEELKRGEEKLSDDRQAFNQQRAAVLLKLSQERAKLFEEAGALTAKAEDIGRRDDELELAEAVVAKMREKNEEMQKGVEKQMQRLKEREELLEQLLGQVAHRTESQDLQMTRMRQDIAAASAGEQYGERLRRVQSLVDKADEQQHRLAAREALLAQNEAKFKAMVAATEAAHSCSYLSELRDGAVVAHLTRGEAELYAKQCDDTGSSAPPNHGQATEEGDAPERTRQSLPSSAFPLPLPHSAAVSRISAASADASAQNTSSQWMSAEELASFAVKAEDRKDGGPALLPQLQASRSSSGAPHGPGGAADATRSPALPMQAHPLVEDVVTLDHMDHMYASQPELPDDSEFDGIDDPEIRALLSAELRASNERVTALAAHVS